MSVERRTLTLPSTDGKTPLHTVLYVPESQPVGIVQLAHGMVDHIGRYSELGEYLAEHGYVFAGHDHLGHGRTAATAEERGYFAKKDGYRVVVDDLKVTNEYLRGEFSGIPLFLMGHSMGSFITRLYVAEYPDTVDGYICHGTAGKNPAAPFGIALIGVMKLIFGDRHRSAFVRSLADGGYNRHFDKSEGEDAWLSRDGERIKAVRDPEIPPFTFTLSAYGDLFRMLSYCNKPSWYSSYPKDMPTLIVSGEADPVGGFGKGVREVYSGLVKAGARSVTLRLYPEARHELFCETNREEVFSDLLEWLKGAAEE